MAPVVEAKSLSAVLDLAEDPPVEYKFDTHESQEPLVLYIARIPGSKDLFLSTVKPLQKVVTASDVQSCLYYVHADSVEDEKNRESLEAIEPPSNGYGNGDTGHDEDQFGSGPVVLEVSPVHGDHPRSPLENLPYSQPPTYSSRSNMSLKRKPVSSDRVLNAENKESPSRHSTRKLLGPRPMHQRLHPVDKAALDMSSGQKNSNPKRWSEQPSNGLKQGRDDCLNNESIEASSQQQAANVDTMHDYRRSSQSTTRNVQSGCNEEVSLTLIRRYDGMQWNVAKISTTCVATLAEPYQTQNEVSIDISTPGYAKFTDEPFKSDQEIRSPETARFFRRHLWKMSDRKRSSLGESSAFHSSSSSSNGLKTKLKVGSGTQQNTMSGNLGETTPPWKGYMFHSPWGGICEISSGITGRSLKCNHTMNSFRSISKDNTPSISVSELRFNLPSSKSSGSSFHNSQTGDSKPKESKRSFFLPLKYTRRLSSFEARGDYNPESTVPDDEKMDLSLGQEHAGGGFGGKQAKLGKLIIEKEGMKMLDLVVAANIGLWWRAYEKTSSMP